MVFSAETVNYTRAISAVNGTDWAEITVDLQESLVLDNFALVSDQSDVVLVCYSMQRKADLIC